MPRNILQNAQLFDFRMMVICVNINIQITTTKLSFYSIEKGADKKNNILKMFIYESLCQYLSLSK